MAALVKNQPICANGLLHAAADAGPVRGLGDGVAGRLVLVTGAGPVGLMTALFARALGAREVAVAAIGTVYAIDDPDSNQGGKAMVENLRGRWSLPTALAFLMWFVFAPQCISTIAVTRRETNGWKWPAFMVGYLFAAAYIMAGITYWLAVFAGL